MAVPQIIDHKITIQSGTSQIVAFGASTAGVTGDLVYVLVYIPSGAESISSITMNNATTTSFVSRYIDTGLEIWWATLTDDAPGGGMEVIVSTTGSVGFQTSILLIRGANSGSPFDPQVDLPKTAAGDTVSLDTENDENLLLAFGFNVDIGAPDYASGWNNVETYNWFLTASTTISAKDTTSPQSGTTATMAGADPATLMLGDAISSVPASEVTVNQTMDNFSQVFKLAPVVVEDSSSEPGSGFIILVEIDAWQS